MQADQSPNAICDTSHQLKPIISRIFDSNGLNDINELSRILKEEISNLGSSKAKNKDASDKAGTPTPTPPSAQKPLTIDPTNLVKLTKLLLQDIQNSELYVINL